ncbi:HD domain-containing protein [Nocardia sp. CDC159]|uniref:HD domain-containing protein n=1 Tax=Nocardia pulmonis TaxID=2951408 RepID=A0A9X2E5B6_9NOCA|nr:MULTISPECIES: HD domain-containing protein [Nocardia]MCM6773115.1 HD domain-containing protein [Nocardia pulmonis]MCM6785582.1 HD domain-containing protein [Nocardia sp. CDC159]
MTARTSLVAGPETEMADAVTELLASCAPPVLVNHSLRTFQFGWALGEVWGETVDRELLYICTVLHDLGLTERYDGPHGFELEGAAGAVEFLRSRGFSRNRIAIVRDAIAWHLDPELIRQGGPEIRLTGAGTGLDTHARRVEQLDPRFIDAVVTALPRLGFRTWLRRACFEQARRKPHSRVAWWVDGGHMPEDMGSPPFTE